MQSPSQITLNAYRLEASSDAAQISVHDIGAFLRRYYVVILIVFACCVAGTYLTLSFLTEQYDTKASVIVKIGRENLDPPSTARNNVFSTGVRHEDVMSEIELIKSPALIEGVVRELGPETFKDHRVAPSGLFAKTKYYIKVALRFGKNQYKNLLYALSLKKRLGDEEAAVVELGGDLTATWQKDTDVIEIALRMPDPALSQRILNQLLNDYFVLRVEVRRGAGVDEFMLSESNKVKSQLAEAEAAEDTWKRSHDLSSVKDQRPLYLQQIRDLSAEHDQTLRDIQTAMRQLSSLTALLKSTPDDRKQSQQEVPNPVIETYRQRLTVLQSERAELLSKYNENSTVIANKNDEIERLKTLVRNEQSTQTSAVTFVANPVRQDLEKRQHEEEIAISGLGARSQAQVSQLNSLKLRMSSFDLADDHLRDLERNRELLETQYMSLAKRKGDADITGALDTNHISNVSLISPPWTDPEPAYPRKMLLMYVALGVGLVLGLGFALMLQYLNDDVRDVKDVQRLLGVPCLGIFGAVGETTEAIS